MRIARFTTGDSPRYGVLEDGSDRIVVLRDDPILGPVTPTGEILDLADVRLLSPVIPRSKVACVGKNYADHIKEMGGPAPDAPIIFIKPNTSVIGPVDPIVLPEWSTEVHHEVELALVIKTICKDIKAEDWRDYVLGYTIGNDCSARDAQRADGQWTRAKGWDSSCPLGPWIVVDPQFDVQNVTLRSWVDGELRQEANTSQMITPVPQLLEYISRIFTLLPGDVVLTGTPAGVGPIEAGQTCSLEIEGIGRMDSPVVRR